MTFEKGATTLKWLTTGILFCLLTGCTTVRSRYDEDTEGWQSMEDGVDAIDLTRGQLEPCLQVRDLAQSRHNRIAAPASFIGDLSRFNHGIISFDFYAEKMFGPHPFAALGEVRIFSDTGGTLSMATLDLMPEHPPYDTWQRYAARLSAPLWGMDEATWNQLLENVIHMDIFIELDSGYDAIHFDNPTLTNNPLKMCYIKRTAQHYIEDPDRPGAKKGAAFFKRRPVDD